MSHTVLVGVRVHSWQWFKLRKWAESHNAPLGQALTDAIQDFLAGQNIPQATIDAWLVEYQGEHLDEVG